MDWLDLKQLTKEERIVDDGVLMVKYGDKEARERILKEFKRKKRKVTKCQQK